MPQRHQRQRAKKEGLELLGPVPVSTIGVRRRDVDRPEVDEARPGSFEHDVERVGIGAREPVRLEGHRQVEL